MDSAINILTEGRDEWKYYVGTNILEYFHQAIMFSKAKMWIQFICTRIVPALNVFNVNTFRAVLLYAILQKKQVCVGKWIHQNMRRCISSHKVGVFFPCLVMVLCKKVGVPMTSTEKSLVGVPMTSTEQSLKPSRSIIGDTLFQQYIELRVKQIKDGNK
ncbi:hypothetical protein J1N35_044007 [Gossypium stocksii]|uniref:Putative plant transposon protein domain-containing protein n=1 Tax=Gossypium stocksii TaxID=47602 RepID=A0A9D3U8P4_9ROSI|nr:hypothetical protein J1N35_044007 [Gossypium stocksii]